MLDKHPRIYSLFGQPVAHSLSPLMFNGTFEKLGMNCTYLASEVSPDQLRDAVRAARMSSISGFNVTMPHKVAIVPLLDKVSDDAKEIGSVNTVVGNERELEGYNTDGEGAAKALNSYGFETRGSKVLVIGAGGAARAVVQRLSREADEVVIINRNREKSQDIADRARGPAKVYGGPLSRERLEAGFRRANLIVNATPLQTTKLVNAFGINNVIELGYPWIFDFAYDAYFQEKTPLRRIHPLELLVQQAGLSYELWFGPPAPIGLMRSILVQHNEVNWK